MKKKIMMFIALIIALVPINISAKEVLTENFVFGGTNDDTFEGVTNTSDGGYVAVGRSASSDFEGLSGYGNNDAIIVKFDKDNNIEWKARYGGSRGDRFYKIIETLDNEYIAVGYSDSTIGETIVNKGNNDGLIVKFDNEGKVVWEKNFGGTNDDRFFGVDVTPDGNFVVTGRVYSNGIDGITDYGDSDAIILKFDKNGNQVWAKTYGGNAFDNFNEVAVDDNDEYIVVGYSSSTNIGNLQNFGSEDAIIVKFDTNGNVVWQEKWGGSNAEQFYKAEHTQDDGVIVVGYSSSTIGEAIVNKGYNDAIIVKYDKNGTIEWQKNFGGANGDFYETVVQLKNGNYLVVGHSQSTDIPELTNVARSDMIIVEYDNKGNIVTKEIIGGDWDDYFKSVTAMPDGGYVVVGHANSSKFADIQLTGWNDAVIRRSEVKYEITAKETENGTFEYVTDDTNKTRISVSPKDGYELEKIIITNSEGEKIEYYEEEGNYYFDLDDDVTIEVIYKVIINPSTGISTYYLLFIIIIAISFISMLFLRKKKYL